MENIKPTNSDYEFLNEEYKLRLVLSINFKNGNYMYMLYVEESLVKQLDHEIGSIDLNFDLAIINLYKSAIEFAKGELSK